MKNTRSFYSTFPTVKVPKGSILFQQSDVPTKGYVVKRGIMKISNLSSGGVEKIISFKVVDEPLPVCWMFSKTTSALFFYQAHTDCELYEIGRDEFNAQMQTDPEFMKAMVDMLSGVYISSSLLVDAHLQTRANTKLLYVFRHLCLRYGKDTKNHITRIQIPLTQQELANYIGLTRETTATELGKLKSEGVITCRRKLYSVDTGLLNERIDDEYNPGVEIGLHSLARSFLF